MLVKNLIEFLKTIDGDLELCLLVPDSGGYDYSIDNIDLNIDDLKITSTSDNKKYIDYE